MKRLIATTALILLVLPLAACGTTTATPKPSSSIVLPASVSNPKIEITDFGPSGTNVGVDFQITNHTARDFQFYWGKFTLTGPDGKALTAYRVPSSAPYELIAPAGTFASGGIFQYSAFQSGHYVVSYDGNVLAQKDL